MGAYALAMATIAGALNWSGWSGRRQAQDLVLKFLEHFAGIRRTPWTSRATRFLQHEGVDDIQKLAQTPQLRGEGASQRMLLSVARPAQLERLFAKLFDEAEFLSPHGLRALWAYHRDHPYEFDAEGYSHQTGWTGLIADVILRRHGAVPALGDVLRDLQERRGADH